MQEWHRPSFKQQKLSGVERCQLKAISLDLYKKPFSLLSPNGKEAYGTFIGSLFSIVTLVIILSYASYKFLNLINYTDYQILVSDQENFYSDSDFFGQEDGFMFAAGITNYDGLSYPIEDP